MPDAAIGLPPGGQPFAGAMFTVGNKVLLGAGSSGFGPVPAETGSCASSPQAAKPNAAAPSKAARQAAGTGSLDMRVLSLGAALPGKQFGAASRSPGGLPRAEPTRLYRRGRHAMLPATGCVRPAKGGPRGRHRALHSGNRCHQRVGRADRRLADPRHRDDLWRGGGAALHGGYRHVWMQELYVWTHAHDVPAGGRLRLPAATPMSGSTSSTRGSDRAAKAWIDLFGVIFLLMPWLALLAWTAWTYVTYSWADRRDLGPEQRHAGHVRAEVRASLGFVLLVGPAGPGLDRPLHPRARRPRTAAGRDAHRAAGLRRASCRQP